MPLEKLMIATHNRPKAQEIAMILQTGLNDLPQEILCLADFPDAGEPEEEGTTYAENAAIKARAAVAATGLPALADDAGLEIDYLGGQPGLHSKRFAGVDTPFSIKMGHLLEKLRGVPDPHRSARFRCAVVIALPTGEQFLFEGSCEGRIAHSPRGSGGFGYDPIFFLPRFGCTMAELPTPFKNRISHRAKALGKAIAAIRAGLAR